MSKSSHEKHRTRPHRTLLRWAGDVFVVACGIGLGKWWIHFHPPPSLAADPIKYAKVARPHPSPQPPASTTVTAPQLAQWEQIATPNLQDAIQRTRELTAANPDQTRELGYQLIAALQKANAYVSAAEFAIAGDPAVRQDLTIAAYHEWGRIQPDQAFASALRIADSTTREFAIQSMLSGWSRADPEGMAETALSFPDGEEKKAALTKALRAWILKDPTAAGDWIMNHVAAVPVADEFFTKDRR